MSWKIIQKCPNYEVSDVGFVRNRNTGHVKRLQLKKDGYLRVSLYFEKKYYHFLVQRIVMDTFKDDLYFEDAQVNHLDGDKMNNSVHNLEWVTRSQNQIHALNTGLVSNKGEKNNFSRLSTQDVYNIRWLSQEGFKNIQLSKYYSTSRNNISTIVNRKSWKHI